MKSRKRWRNCKSWLWKQYGFLIPPHLLTNFEIRKYYQTEPTFNVVYSRDNLPKIKYGAYVINLDKYSNIGTRRVALWLDNNNNNNNNNSVIYLDSFGVEYIPKEIKAFNNNNNNNNNKNIKTNIFTVHAYDSIMCGYFCIGFIDFILQEKL